ncbi:hypothetical protein P4361_18775 [Fictibacillus sp. B-59209]|uniref:hypothetical protein n=1 Tax=Fictibacillus sp. B-59209 TaxID=3024873 RepID=UPI002E1A2507|nr:hypothetical protein [Fictibacillus sp. B-59209]
MVNYTFDGTKSTFKNDIGEATTTFKKVSESRVDLEVKLTHYESNTVATYKKYVAVLENGVVQHYPIKGFTVQGVNIGEHDTVKKYFTHILGVDGYREFYAWFITPYKNRKEFELNSLLGRH